MVFFVKKTDQIILLKPIIYLILLLFCCLAYGKPPSSVHILSINEHLEIEMPIKSRLSMGAPNVLSYKLFTDKNKVLIKALKVGYSEIIFWENNRIIQTHQVYVISKKKQVDSMHISQALESIGLSYSIQGPLIIAQGEVRKTEDYLSLKKLKQKYPMDLELQTQFHPSLKNFIIADIYQALGMLQLQEFYCQVFFLNIDCFYQRPSQKTSLELLKYLKKKWMIELIGLPTQTYTNYQVHIKLIKVDQQNSRDQNIDFKSKISSIVEQIPSDGSYPIWVDLQGKKLKFSTLMQAEGLIKENGQLSLRLGQTQHLPHTESSSLENLFSGVILKISIQTQGDQHLVLMESESSKSTDFNKALTEHQSEFYVKENNPQTIYFLKYQSQGQVNQFTPFIQNIPILGSLLQKESYLNNEQNIYLVFNLIKV